MNKVFVGCNMVILNPTGDKILVATRKTEPDINGWQVPGGTVEYGNGENLIDAAVRETEEETGLKIENSQFLCIMNSFYYGKERPVHVGFVGRSRTEEIPPNPEPHKAEDWHWADLNNLPEGKWFRLSKFSVDFYSKLQKDPMISRFVIDEEYVHAKEL